jgi:hypothetical protein
MKHVRTYSEEHVDDHNPDTDVVIENDTAEPVVTSPHTFRAAQLVWYVFGVIETLLLFRVVLKMLGANPVNPFVNLIYGLSEPFVAPFATIFTISAANQFVVEWSTFIALAVYAVIAYGIVRLIEIAHPTHPTVHHTADNV